MAVGEDCPRLLMSDPNLSSAIGPSSPILVVAGVGRGSPGQKKVGSIHRINWKKI